MKKVFKAWAVKLRGKSFAPDINGHPLLFKNKASADQYAWYWNTERKVKAECVRVNVRVEEAI